MIAKTEAVVLRTAPYSRTSQIVTWLTPEYGRLVTMIKGAHRPKSMFLGQYDLFYTCELLYYSRDRHGLHIARECSPVNIRSGFRTNWRSAAMASYFCDLLSRVTPDGHPQPELYKLLGSTLDFLCDNDAKLQTMFWFELKLAETAGLTPQLTTCAACGVSLPASGTSVFSISRGGIVCPACAGRHDHGANDVTPDILAMLRHWQDAANPRSAQNTRCSGEQLSEFERLLGLFLNYHLDTIPKSRYTAIQTVSFRLRDSRTQKEL